MIKALLRIRANKAPYKDKALILTTTPTTYTATATGATTGTILAGTDYVEAVGVGAHAPYIIKLPALAAGEVIYLRNISTLPFELQTSVMASIFFNGNENNHSIAFADNVFATAIGINATNIHLEFETYPQGD